MVTVVGCGLHFVLKDFMKQSFTIDVYGTYVPLLWLYRGVVVLNCCLLFVFTLGVDRDPGGLWGAGEVVCL